jgi:RES domain-containing protein
MNLAAVAGLASRSITAVWYRAVDPRYLPTALNYSHTRLFASRYYEGRSAATPFDIVYLAENPLVALFEAEALFGSPLIPGGLIANPARSWLTINADLQITRVADLTNVSDSQMPLLTSAQELTGDWKGYRQRSASTGVSTPVGVAPTQELGATLHSSGLFEGFLTISAKMPYQRVLGLFPERLTKGSFVRYTYVDSAGRTQTLHIP